MPFPSRRCAWRRAVTVGLLAALCAVSATTTAGADPVALRLNYTCNFPLLVPQPLQLAITSDIPKTLAIGELSGSFAINATATVSAEATVGLNAVSTATFGLSERRKVPSAVPLSMIFR